MLKLYYHPTPNSMKVAVLLEELDLPYEVATSDIMKGEQHAPAFRKVNPNAKVPAIVDDGVTVFDSHAILLYLAEKHDKFLPLEIEARAATFSWLEFVASGLSPFSGQAAHFLHYAPEDIPYAKNRYIREVERSRRAPKRSEVPRRQGLHDRRYRSFRLGGLSRLHFRRKGARRLPPCRAVRRRHERPARRRSRLAA